MTKGKAKIDLSDLILTQWFILKKGITKVELLFITIIVFANLLF